MNAGIEKKIIYERVGCLSKNDVIQLYFPTRVRKYALGDAFSMGFRVIRSRIQSKVIRKNPIGIQAKLAVVAQKDIHQKKVQTYAIIKTDLPDI